MIKRCWYKASRFVAGSAIIVGWQVINKFTNSDHIVMTIRTECRRVNVTWIMTKGAACESTGCMANTAVLAREHMVERFTARRDTMTRVTSFAHNVRAGMIDESASESIGVMATTTVRGRCYVGGHCG